MKMDKLALDIIFQIFAEQGFKNLWVNHRSLGLPQSLYYL